MVHDAEEGQLLGSEESLLAHLGVSRATLRQAARLLEQERLLVVKRGINGGYFAARPDLASIAEAVSSYLEVVDTEREDVTEIASVLWIQVVKKAAFKSSKEKRKIIDPLKELLFELVGDAPFEVVRDMDATIRRAIFGLIKSQYTELVFQINAAYANRHFRPASEKDHTAMHRQFVRDWRRAKIMELEGIVDNNPTLAVMAAQHSRRLWHERLWGHPPQP